MDFCVFDTEGRGYRDSGLYSMVDLAILKVIDGKVSRWESKFNPMASISAIATSIHGISLGELADAPVFAEKAQSFLDFIEDLPLVAFNVNADRSILNLDLTIAGLEPLPYERFFCAERIALKMYGRAFNANSLAEFLKLSSRAGLHGAMIDTEMLLACLQVMQEDDRFAWELGKSSPRVPKAREWKMWMEGHMLHIQNLVNNEVHTTVLNYPEDHVVICSGKTAKVLPSGERRPHNPIGPDLVFFNGKEFEIRNI